MLMLSLLLALAAAPAPHDIAAYPLLWQTPEMARVEVRRQLPFAAAGGRRLHLDLFLPAGPGPHPVAVLVNGSGDGPAREMRRMPGYEGWARLLASQGMAAVVPEAGLGNGLQDGAALVQHLAAAGPPLGLDPARIGLWASSADAPVAVALLAEVRPAAAVLLYAIGDAGQAPAGVPVLVVRAGRDAPSWNEAADRMLAQAEQRKLPWTVLRPPGLRHAFDLFDDGPESWGAVRAAALFLRERLGVPGPATLPEAPPPLAPGPDPAAREALARWRARDWEGAAAAYRGWLAGHAKDGVATYRLGVALHMSGKHAEAAERIAHAVRMGEAGPSVLYNLACARAKAGQGPGAMKALEQAVEEGFDDVEGMARDPDLAGLRAADRFQKLVARMRKQE